jgi:transcriptional regulator with XRE-family HTH domain
MERGVRGSGVSVDPERVRRARLNAGLTLAQVAGGELSRTFIHQVERGLARPSPAVLRLIARRTGQPVAYFVKRSAGPTSGREVSSGLAETANRLRRFIAVSPLNPTERAAMKLVEMTLRQGAAVARTMRR